MIRFALFFAAIATSVVSLACSSADDSLAPAKSTSDAGAAPMDASADADANVPFPAFTPEVPQIQNHGGAVLDSPRILTVTWKDDPNRGAVEDFDDAIGTSDYWKTLSEYGIGEATSDPSLHIEISDPIPSSMTEDDLTSLITTNVENASWTSDTPETVYIVYVPESVQVTDSTGADACESAQGYHDEVTDSNVSHLSYAIVLEGCRGSTDVVDFATEVASHELVEAATDPHSSSDTAWVGFDLDHLAWEIWQERQDEVADACELYVDANYEEPAPFTFTVQKIWSNASAVKGHSPCVRAPETPYFNTTPLDLEPLGVTLPFYTDTMSTKGFRVAVGATKTVRFGFYSDAPTSPWTFQVVEGDGLTPLASSQVSISTKTTSGKNGDTADVSFTVNSAGESTGILVTAISVMDGQSPHYMPVLIGAY